jgi:hypothetical protein
MLVFALLIAVLWDLQIYCDLVICILVWFVAVQNFMLLFVSIFFPRYILWVSFRAL